VFQQTSKLITSAPPSFVTVPPVAAVVLVIRETAAVVRAGI
jgi:hypothetical protein